MACDEPLATERDNRGELGADVISASAALVLEDSHARWGWSAQGWCARRRSWEDRHGGEAGLCGGEALEDAPGPRLRRTKVT